MFFSTTEPQNPAFLLLRNNPEWIIPLVAAMAAREDFIRLIPILLEFNQNPQQLFREQQNNDYQQQQRVFNNLNRFHRERLQAEHPQHQRRELRNSAAFRR